MREFIIFILCCVTIPVWAAPSLLDLDSWQLPEEEEKKPAPVAAPQTPKPQAPKKAKTTKGPELKVQISADNKYTVASSTQEVAEIPVMNLSAKQLLSRFAGKGRFHILFNANIPTTTDTEITAEDGTKYAMAVFGNENQKYRILLFKNGTEQPLIAVADDWRGKLNMLEKYRVDVGITEEEIKQNNPAVSVQEIKDQATQQVYHVYKLEGPLFMVFQSGKLAKRFANEQEFTAFSNQVQPSVPAPQAPHAQLTQPDIPVPSTPKAPQKRLFSRIVQGQSRSYSTSSSNRTRGRVASPRIPRARSK